MAKSSSRYIFLIAKAGCIKDECGFHGIFFISPYILEVFYVPKNSSTTSDDLRDGKKVCDTIADILFAPFAIDKDVYFQIPTKQVKVLCTIAEF